jgi:hypothetical protein
MAFLNCLCSRCGRIEPYEEPSATYVEGMLFARAKHDGWDYSVDRKTLCPSCAGVTPLRAGIRDHEAMRERAGKGDES